MPHVFSAFFRVCGLVSEIFCAFFAIGALFLNLYDRTKSWVLTSVLSILVAGAVVYLYVRKGKAAKAAAPTRRLSVLRAVAGYLLRTSVFLVVFVAGSLVFYSSRYQQCNDKTHLFRNSFQIGRSVELFAMPEMIGPFERFLVSIRAREGVVKQSYPHHIRVNVQGDIIKGLRAGYDQTREGGELDIIVMVYPARGAFTVSYSGDGRVTSVSEVRFYGD